MGASGISLAPFKAGATFSYAGVVSGLDPATTWGAIASVTAQGVVGHVWPPLTVTFAQSSDYSSTHNYDIALFAASKDTYEWRLTSVISFDILFFDQNNPDPVLLTQTILIPIVQPITYKRARR